MIDPSESHPTDPRAVSNVPCSLSAQAAVLGLAMNYPDAALEELRVTLRPEHFYPSGGSHALLWQVLCAMADEREVIDLITVTHKADLLGHMDRIGGPGVISELYCSYSVQENLDAYIRILHDKYLLRSMREIGRCMAQDAVLPDAAGALQLDTWHAALTELFTGGAKKGTWRSFHDGVEEAFEIIDAAHKHRGRTSGIDTGFFDLNRMCDGLKPGQVIVVAGRPGMGKTAFGMNIAENVARGGHPVGVFSVEMTFSELSVRMVCSACGINLQRIRDGFLSHSDLDALGAKALELSNLPIWIDPSSPLTIADFRVRARELVARRGAKLLVVDYIQLMSGIGRRGQDNRALEVTEISVGIKQIAKELGVPVIVLAQLNRKVEDRRGNRPMMSDLKESGSIEQDADMVLLLYREEYYKKTDENEGIVDVIVAKQRNGPTGDFRLRFDAPTTRFSNLTDRQYSNNEEHRQHH